MSKIVKPVKNENKEMEIKVHSDAFESYYSNFFQTEITNNEAIIGFGQKTPFAQDGNNINLIRHRIVTTHSGLKVLSSLIQQALDQLEKITNKNDINK